MACTSKSMEIFGCSSSYFFRYLSITLIASSVGMLVYIATASIVKIFVLGGSVGAISCSLPRRSVEFRRNDGSFLSAAFKWVIYPFGYTIEDISAATNDGACYNQVLMEFDGSVSIWDSAVDGFIGFFFLLK